jgi:DNA polymerase I
MKTFVLIDGHSLAYRMYFALEQTRMSTRDKQPTWAVYGFFNAIFSLLKQIQPDGIALSFDVGSETFRNKLYEAYKANRESMPDALKVQMKTIQEGVRKLGIPIYELEGYEADDVIGTLSKQAAEQGVLVKILTGDQDSFQLIEDGKVEVLIPSRTPKEGLKNYLSEDVFKKWGVHPLQVTDFKGLKGDTSDNIPGVPGIGDKTAAKLLAEFGSLENLYANLEKLPANKLKEKLVTFQEQAFLSKKLAIIDRHSPITVDLNDCHLVIPDLKGLIQYLEAYEFRSFIQQAPQLLAPFLTPEEIQSLQGASTTTTLKSLAPEGQTNLFQGKEPSLQNTSSPDAVKTLDPEIGELLEYWTIPFQTIQDEGSLDQLVKDLTSTPVFSLDLETTGLDVLNDEIVGISITYGNGLAQFDRPSGNFLNLNPYPKSFQGLQVLKSQDNSKNPTEKTVYIPLVHQGVSPLLETQIVLKALKPFLESSHHVKIVHNAKFEVNMFLQHEIQLGGLVFDTMVASYVQNPDRRHGLKQLAQDYLGHRMHELTDFIGKGKKTIRFDEVPCEEAFHYAACDAKATWELASYLLKTYPETEFPNQWSLFYEIENPLALILAQMERTGITLDVPYLKTLEDEIDRRLSTLETEVYASAGCQFNLNSPKQVGEVLFEKLQIKPLRKTASKSGFSTDAKVLEQLAEEHEVVQKLLDYRGLYKLKSTYVESLPSLVNPKTHRIHTSFNQTITATGRLSSSNPNLQNIPIRSDLGRLIRQAFVPEHRTQQVLMSADYSQIELRLLAHFSEDPHLVEAFQKGIDVHSATAALVFGVPIEAVTKEQRYQAKTVNFGVIYGQSAHGLSQQLKISRYEAQQFIDLYFAQYDHVKGYIEGIKAEAHRTGKVETLCHRVRDLRDGLNNSVRSIREFSERAAFNTPLQGSAADLLKVAMIRLSQKFQEEKIKSAMILQVHDELVLEVHQSELEEVKGLVTWAMALDQPLKVPLEIDIHVGQTWMES